MLLFDGKKLKLKRRSIKSIENMVYTCIWGACSITLINLFFLNLHIVQPFFVKIIVFETQQSSLPSLAEPLWCSVKKAKLGQNAGQVHLQANPVTQKCGCKANVALIDVDKHAGIKPATWSKQYFRMAQ